MAGQRNTTHNDTHASGDARKYVRYVIGRIPGLAELAPLQELLKLQQSCSPSARDTTVLRAIWAMRNNLAQSSELSWLVSSAYERMPRTAAYLASRSTPPFDYDGIIWTEAYPMPDIEASLTKGCRYLNAFDHAMTALIVRGWGLSGSCACDGTGWKPDASIATLWDASITLSLFEALSELAGASRAQERCICEQAIEEILTLRERGDWRKVPTAAYARLDQLIEMES